MNSNFQDLSKEFEELIEYVDEENTVTILPLDVETGMTNIFGHNTDQNEVQNLIPEPQINNENFIVH